jgi:DNA invertase Pin-like site-specific DNA recombinase
MLIGYARISRDESNHIAQVADLKKAGCETVIEETGSGSRYETRPKLQALIAGLKPDDTLCVWKLDRLARSLPDFSDIMKQLEKVGAHFRSITESFDTTSPGGKLLRNMLAVIAEFERDMIIARTKAGLRTAKDAGRIGGAPRKFNALKAAEIIRVITSNERTPSEIARIEGVHVKTIHRLMARSTKGAAGTI